MFCLWFIRLLPQFLEFHFFNVLKYTIKHIIAICRTRLGPNEVDVKDLSSLPNASKKDSAAPAIQKVASPGKKQVCHGSYPLVGFLCKKSYPFQEKIEQFLISYKNPHNPKSCSKYGGTLHGSGSDKAPCQAVWTMFSEVTIAHIQGSFCPVPVALASLLNWGHSMCHLELSNSASASGTVQKLL